MRRDTVSYATYKNKTKREGGAPFQASRLELDATRVGCCNLYANQAYAV